MEEWAFVGTCVRRTSDWSENCWVVTGSILKLVGWWDIDVAIWSAEWSDVVGEFDMSGSTEWASDYVSDNGP